MDIGASVGISVGTAMGLSVRHHVRVVGINDVIRVSVGAKDAAFLSTFVGDKDGLRAGSWNG